MCTWPACGMSPCKSASAPGHTAWHILLAGGFFGHHRAVDISSKRFHVPAEHLLSALPEGRPVQAERAWEGESGSMRFILQLQLESH